MNDNYSQWELGSVVGIVTSLSVGDLAFDTRQRQKICLFPTTSRQALVPTHPPSQGVKRPWYLPTLLVRAYSSRNVELTIPPSSAEVKNLWNFTITLYYCQLYIYIYVLRYYLLAISNLSSIYTYFILRHLN